MILDPDEPLGQARSPRQSLIRTAEGWAVLGQPTEEVEARFKTIRAELGALCPGRDVSRQASRMAFDLYQRGVV